jgi:hypothetical protein
MSKIRLLPGMKFMSGGVLYRPGDILPDTADALELARQKKAEYIDDENGTQTPVLPVDPDSYEAQSVRILESIAKERGVDIPRGTKKAGIIELLKAWDAEHSGDDDEGDS